MAMSDRYYWQEKESRMPCNCGCPDCTRYDILIVPTVLTVADKGGCYTGSNIAVAMPLTGTVDNTWCVGLKGNVGGPLTVYVAERLFEGDIPGFIIGGVKYDYFTLAAGEEACVCFNGINWVVTGDAVGAYEKQPT